MDINELKARRIAVNLSQAKLGELLGISVETIKSWEQGRNPISKIAGIAINATLSDIQSKQLQAQRQEHIKNLAKKPLPKAYDIPYIQS